MPEYGMTRNAEGYPDYTPYQAITGQAKAGEIWKYDAYEVLILRNHGTFCNILTLVESTSDTRSIPVMSRSIRYTNPAMIRYCFNNGLGQFIKKIPYDDFEAIMDEVREALGFAPAGASEEKAGEPAQEPTPKANPSEVEALKTRLILERREAEKAKAKFDVLQGMYDALLDRFITKGADD